MKKLIIFSLITIFFMMMGCTDKTEKSEEKEIYRELLNKVITESKSYNNLKKADTFTSYVAEGMYIIIDEDIYYYSFEDLFSLTEIQIEDLLFKLAIAGPKGNVNIVYSDKRKGIFEFKNFDDISQNGDNVAFEPEKEVNMVNGEKKIIKDIQGVSSNKIIIKEIIELNVESLTILFEDTTNVNIENLYVKAIENTGKTITSSSVTISGINTLKFIFTESLNPESKYKFFSNGIYFGKFSEELNNMNMYKLYNDEIKFIANKVCEKDIFGIKTIEYYINIKSENINTGTVEFSIYSEGKDNVIKTVSITDNTTEIKTLFIPDFVNEFKIIIKNTQGDIIDNGVVVQII